MKRDDQILALRLQAEETRNRMTKAARDRDRVLAQIDAVTTEVEFNGDDAIENSMQAGTDSDAGGSRIIVIHPGSQNLRIGLSSDALPKTIPMVIARKSDKNEVEHADTEPRPKRRRVDEDAALAEDDVHDEEVCPSSFILRLLQYPKTSF